MSKAVNAAKVMADKAMNATKQVSASSTGASISTASTAVKAAAEAQTAAAAQAVPTISAADIAKAVKESLSDLMSGDFNESILLDTDVIAQKTYKKIDILIGTDANFEVRGYAR